MVKLWDSIFVLLFRQKILHKHVQKQMYYIFDFFKAYFLY